MDTVTLTDEILERSRFSQELGHRGCCGAQVLFEGIVRGENEGRRVERVEYECYKEMAEKEFRKIIEEVRSSWPVHVISIAHRIGKVPVGGTSLLIGIGSPHRREALQALEYSIEEIKKRVPIWKKEVYSTDDSRWLGAS